MSTDFHTISTNEIRFDSDDDAKKRRLNESDTYNQSEMSKRRRPGMNVEIPEGDINVKMLMPTSAAGAIIGKNGETIATLEKETQCQVTISKGSDLFPKTTERVVLITGKFHQVIEVITFIQEKIRERRDLAVASDPFDYKYTSRTLELKMIIPGTSAGGIIGKGGDFVRTVQDTCGLHIQMSTKDMTVDLGTNERVITLAGTEVRELMDGAQMIISKISQDSNIYAPSYVNTNYNYLQPTSARAPYPSPDRSYKSAAGDRYSQRASSGFEFDQMSRSARPFSPHSSAGIAPAGDWSGSGASGGMGNLQVLQFLDGLSQTLRNNGFNEPAVGDIMQAMQTLAKYNVLGLGLGFGLSAISDGSSRNGGQPGAFAAPVASDMEVGYVSRSIGGRGRSPPPQFYDDRRSKPSRSSHAERLMKVIREEPNLVEMCIPDAVAGALLGKQGHRLNEVQRMTGATIDISKRKLGDEGGQSQGGRRPDRQLIIEGSPEAVRAARLELEASLNERGR